MNLRMLSIIVMLAICSAARAEVVVVSITPIELKGFFEFKCESDQKGERATGHITDTGAKTWEWDMGDNKQNIWFWWDTLQGVADVSISIIPTNERWPNGTYMRPAVILCQGRCAHWTTGEQQVLKTQLEWVAYLQSHANDQAASRGNPPRDAKEQHKDNATNKFDPYCVENSNGAITHIYFRGVNGH